MSTQPATASQTIGPFWHLLGDPAWDDLTRFGAAGERMVLQSRLVGLRTRVYFAGESQNETDPLLSLIADPTRRATLIAVPDGPAHWRIDIRLQGNDETMFLEI